MDFTEYQSATDHTAIYPDAGKGTDAAVNYCAVSLAGEAGEILNKWKKHLRGDPDANVEDLFPVLAKEVGDVLWYMARLCLEMGYSFETVAKLNLDKLESRRNRHHLVGSGDDR